MQTTAASLPSELQNNFFKALGCISVAVVAFPCRLMIAVTNHIFCHVIILGIVSFGSAFGSKCLFLDRDILHSLCLLHCPFFYQCLKLARVEAHTIREFLLGIFLI